MIVPLPPTADYEPRSERRRKALPPARSSLAIYRIARGTLPWLIAVTLVTAACSGGDAPATRKSVSPAATVEQTVVLASPSAARIAGTPVVPSGSPTAALLDGVRAQLRRIALQETDLPAGLRRISAADEDNAAVAARTGDAAGLRLRLDGWGRQLGHRVVFEGASGSGPAWVVATTISFATIDGAKAELAAAGATGTNADGALLPAEFDRATARTDSTRPLALPSDLGDERIGLRAESGPAMALFRRGAIVCMIAVQGVDDVSGIARIIDERIKQAR